MLYPPESGRRRLGTAAPGIEHMVDDDPVEPGPEAAPTLEGGEPGDRLDQDLVSGVLGVLRVGEHAFESFTGAGLHRRVEMSRALPVKTRDLAMYFTRHAAADALSGRTWSRSCARGCPGTPPRHDREVRLRSRCKGTSRSRERDPIRGRGQGDGGELERGSVAGRSSIDGLSSRPIRYV